jgi:hypothetical protein
MLTDNALYSASSAAIRPFVQSMTVLYNNTRYIPWLCLIICEAHSDLSGLMPVSQAIKRKTWDDLPKYLEIFMA